MSTFIGNSSNKIFQLFVRVGAGNQTVPPIPPGAQIEVTDAALAAGIIYGPNQPPIVDAADAADGFIGLMFSDTEIAASRLYPPPGWPDANGVPVLQPIISWPS